MKVFPEWGWENLSARYIENALFSLDETIVPTDHTDRNPKNITTDTCKLQTKPIIKDQPPAQKINDEDFTPLPPKRTSGKNALRLKCRNLMKEISGLTFLMKEKEQLSSHANDLEGILKRQEVGHHKKQVQLLKILR